MGNQNSDSPRYLSTPTQRFYVPRGHDGWMASLTQWTWVLVGSRRRWRTGKPGVLQSIGSQRVRHDWATEQQMSWEPISIFPILPSSSHLAGVVSDVTISDVKRIKCYRYVIATKLWASLCSSPFTDGVINAYIRSIMVGREERGIDFYPTIILSITLNFL